MKKYQLLIVVTVLFIACTPAKMALDNNGWNEKEEFSVNGRQGILINQKLSFGDYRTVSVKRSWTKGNSMFAGWAWGRPGYDDYSRIIGVEFSNKKQSVKFELSDQDANESSVFCVTKVKTKDFVLGNNPNSLLNISLEILGRTDAAQNVFWTKIYLKNEEKPWEMMLDNDAIQEKRKTYVGVISQSRDQYYTLHPVYALEMKNGKTGNILAGSLGIEIRNKQGKPLAAVSLIDKGMVYFNGVSSEEKFLMANICTALLLQEQIA